MEMVGEGRKARGEGGGEKETEGERELGMEEGNEEEAREQCEAYRPIGLLGRPSPPLRVYYLRSDFIHALT